MWHKINKIIDGLHIQNHKQRSCHERYNPLRFNELHPEANKANTMAAEQFFAWLSKHTKQLNAMGKLNQMFFMHCIIQRKNDYVIERIKEGAPLEANGARSAYKKYSFK